MSKIKRTTCLSDASLVLLNMVWAAVNCEDQKKTGLLSIPHYLKSVCDLGCVCFVGIKMIVSMSVIVCCRSNTANSYHCVPCAAVEIRCHRNAATFRAVPNIPLFRSQNPASSASPQYCRTPNLQEENKPPERNTTISQMWISEQEATETQGAFEEIQNVQEILNKNKCKKFFFLNVFFSEGKTCSLTRFQFATEFSDTFIWQRCCHFNDLSKEFIQTKIQRLLLLAKSIIFNSQCKFLTWKHDIFL